MQVHVPNKTLFDECSGHNAVKYFPYLSDRLDAIKDIRSFQSDMWLRSNHGRQMLKSNGNALNAVRIGSLPWHIVKEIEQVYGKQFYQDLNLQHKIFKNLSEWSPIYGG